MGDAYVTNSTIPLTGIEAIDVTTNGYKWLFPSGEAKVLNWSTSSTNWSHPTLQSAETQADFSAAFQYISQFIDVSFNFLGYIEGTTSRLGYERAYELGSNLNITFSYNGRTANGATINDNEFNNRSETAFCYFPNSAFDTKYRGAAGDTWLNYNNYFISTLTFEPGTSGFALLLHEVLHGLGLKHPHDSGGTGRPTYTDIGLKYLDRQWVSVMSYDLYENGGDGAYSGSMPTGPMLYDAIALQYLYGESQLNSGATRYDLRQYLGNYYYCQWDFSGIDTLDATGLEYGIVVEMDLAYLSNGRSNHHAGFITTALDYLALSLFNPSKWTWLWGEYENIEGTPYDDVFIGNDLDNEINGGGRNDFMAGGDGNDKFDWNPNLRDGYDTMEGGLGNDTYVLDSIYDVIIENPYEGIDEVIVGFNFSLMGKSLENISTFGNQTMAVSFTGNDWSNRLMGGDGNDSLYGNEGNDTLQGGFGNDLLEGGGGDDEMAGGAGNDTLRGGNSTDTAVFEGRRINYIVSGTAVPGTITVSSANEGLDILVGIELLKFTDGVYPANADSTPPTVANLSPADEVIGVALSSNIVVTFSESIARGAGSVSIKTLAGVTFAFYDAATSSNLTILGNTLIINPSVDLNFSTSYRIDLSAGSVKDLAGNSYAGTTSYNFTTAVPPRVVSGTSGNDILTNSLGNERFDGGSGLDEVRFAETRSTYTTKRQGAEIVITGPGNIDTLQSVERAIFSDGAVGFDIDGTGGKAYRLYQAAFDRTPDERGVGFWMSAIDKGFSLVDAATNFMNSDEFRALYGSNPSNSQFMDLLYQNVMNRAPDTGYYFWLDALDGKGQFAGTPYSKAAVLVQFSESAENYANVIGVISNGFPYQPYVG